MAFQVSNRPSRWAAYCPGSGFNFCNGISSNDFTISWNVDAANDELDSVSIGLNPNGLISSITTKPNGQVNEFGGGGVETMNYDSGSDTWIPASTYGLTDSTTYFFQVTLDVELTTGDSCSYDLSGSFQYVDLGSFPEASPSISGVQQVGEILTGSDGYSDADGDPQDVGNTVRRWYSYSDSAGTVDETLIGSGSTYTLQSSDTDRYIRFKVIPAATSGPSPGVEASSLVFGIVVTDQVAYTVTNDNSGTISISNGNISKTGQGLGVDWGDGSGLDVYTLTTSTIALSHTYSSGASKTATIYGVDTNVNNLTASNQSITGVSIEDLDNLSVLVLSQNGGLTAVTLPTNNNVSWSQLQLNQTGLAGTFDMSMIDMPTTANFFNCSSLTGVIFPSSGTCTNLRLDGCDITGTLDCSGLDLNDRVRFSSNSNLTGITFGTSTGTTRLFQGFNCDITGTFDLSMFDFTSTAVQISGNSNMTAITFNGAAQDCTFIQFNGCDITGTQDLSMFTNIEQLFVQSNSNMTSLTLPATSGDFARIRADGCALGYIDFTGFTFKTTASIELDNNGMTAAEVNCILVDLANTLPSGSGTVDIFNNTAPDGSSGGCDGTTAVTDITALGFTVSTD